MLPGVILHVGKAAVPVDFPMHSIPGAKGPRGLVEHLAVLFPGVNHEHTTQRPDIRGLSAALRVEGRPVQGHQKMPVAALKDPRDHGVKFF